MSQSQPSGPVVAGARRDEPAELLVAAIEAVRSTPAPWGHGGARLAVLAHAAAQVQGLYLQAVAAAESDGTAAEHDCRGAADLLTAVAGVPVSQARSDAGQARRLAVLPGLLEAVASGDVALAAGRLVARAWTALPRDLRDEPTAAALVLLAQLVDQADLKAKVDELVAALAPDALDAAHADAEDRGGFDLAHVGAQTDLRGAVDRLHGEWLEGILAAKAQADGGGPEDTRSPSRRRLDALLDLLRGAVDGGLTPDSSLSAPSIVVVATAEALLGQPAPQPSLLDDLEQAKRSLWNADDSTDHSADTDTTADIDGPADLASRVAAQPPRLWPSGPTLWATAHTREGTRIGPRTLQKLCCESTLTRLLVDAAGHPLDSTPNRRQLTARERRALEHRDGYRCQRRGCRRPARSCVPHHVDPWHLGGLTVLANMVLLCRACHHELHDRAVQLPLRDGRVIGPRGWVRGPAPP